MANPWIDFLKRFKKDHPEIKQSDLFRKAGEEYKKKSHKQHGGLGALTPANYSGGDGVGTSGAGLQLKATLYGGAKRSAKRRSAKRARRSARRSTRRSS
jgi:hypothetical protein